MRTCITTVWILTLALTVPSTSTELESCDSDVCDESQTELVSEGRGGKSLLQQKRQVLSLSGDAVVAQPPVPRDPGAHADIKRRVENQRLRPARAQREPATADTNGTDAPTRPAETRAANATTEADPKAAAESKAAADAAAAADEPESAPAVYVTIAVGLLAVLFILSFLLVCLVGLQALWKRNERLKEKILEEHRRERAEKLKSGGKKGSQSKEGAPVKKKTSMDDTEVMAHVNGDPERLRLLLGVATAKNPVSEAEELVKKGTKANKLKVSANATKQIAQGLVTLAKAVQSISSKRNPARTPKQKLQDAFKDIHSTVHVCRAFKQSVVDHELHGWTSHHHEVAQNKYDEGARPHAMSNVKIAKDAKDAKKGGLANYLASEVWVDHAGGLLIAIFSQICGFVYAMYLKYRFPKMYAFMGPFLLLSRGEAVSIILITMLMVLIMCRGFLTFLRQYVQWSQVLVNLLDKHALMHKWCGAMLVICAALHIVGHLFGSIPAIINERDIGRVNDAFTYGTKIKFNFNTWGGAFRSWPAVTGVLCVVVLALFWATANEKVRRKYFEAFHYPHLVLLVAWAAALTAHGGAQWLGVGAPLGLLFVCPCVAYYSVERLMKISQASQEAIRIEDATIKHGSVLLNVSLRNSGVTYETGMYCMVKVPEISNFEWHPFTIASAGGDPDLKVIFALAGDWTKELQERLAKAQKDNTPYPKICVRGGYGAAATGMVLQKHIVMVGAGVGATPFLSFLATICRDAQAQERRAHGPGRFDGVESAVFFWVSREPEDFSWVYDFNKIIESSPSLKDRVSVRLCLTKTLDTAAKKEISAAEVAMFWAGTQVALDYNGATGVQAELGVPTQFGRPDWNKELSAHAAALTKKARKGLKSGEALGKLEVGVFVCGNPMLVSAVEKSCDELHSDEVEFPLHAEQF